MKIFDEIFEIEIQRSTYDCFLCSVCFLQAEIQSTAYPPTLFEAGGSQEIQTLQNQLKCERNICGGEAAKLSTCSLPLQGLKLSMTSAIIQGTAETLPFLAHIKNTGNWVEVYAWKIRDIFQNSNFSLILELSSLDLVNSVKMEDGFFSLQYIKISFSLSERQGLGKGFEC